MGNRDEEGLRGGGSAVLERRGSGSLARPDRIAAEERLGRAAEAERARRKRTSHLIHDIRGPLSSIQSYTEILLRYPPETRKERDQFLRTIEEEVERVDRLLKAVAELDRLEAATDAGTPLQAAPLDLRIVLERALLEVAPLASAKEVSIELVSEGAAEMFEGDTEILTRAVLEMLSNAVKFSHRQSAVRVALEFDQGDDDRRTVRIVVDDEGIGVAPAARDQLFAAFFQAAVPPDPMSPRGSGLGLAIARLAAERHEGTLTYEPLARGSRFTLALPGTATSRPPA